MATKTEIVVPATGVGGTTTRASKPRFTFNMQWVWPYLFLVPFLLVYAAFFGSDSCEKW